jgi:hypothetical protein
LIAAIKDWLPIMKRNRVALGFAFAALVMFVTWNFLPYYGAMRAHESDGLVFMMIWPEMVNPDRYLNVIRSPDIDGFIEVVARMAILLSGLLVLTIVPLWKIIHVSRLLTIPLAVANCVGGLAVLWLLFDDNMHVNSPPYAFAALIMIAFTMLVVSTALFIFKNELGLRHELEVKKMMGGGDSR